MEDNWRDYWRSNNKRKKPKQFYFYMILGILLFIFVIYNKDNIKNLTFHSNTSHSSVSQKDANYLMNIEALFQDLEEYSNFLNTKILAQAVNNKEYDNYDGLINQIELVLNGEVDEFISLRNHIKPNLINIKNYLDKDIITSLDYTIFIDSLIQFSPVVMNLIEGEFIYFNKSYTRTEDQITYKIEVSPWH